ncbi:MAG TPA: AbrB/MazE/SpoVT family DNA-binding domain-containing protein, partial [Thermoanaerobaculia bacterium]|nr:AbrB/MazE/SpoVT family DNA-binding domain-containing protein [Thermoanaerobaculia bacterium]
MANTVGEKGQVVIEKPIRDALGIRPGFVAIQDLRTDHVEIRFYPPEHDRSLRGVLAGAIRRSRIPRYQLRRTVLDGRSTRDGCARRRD